MSSSLDSTIRETIILRFVQDDINKVISEVIDVSLRQMQKMKLNWTHFDDVISSRMFIDHRSRRLTKFHENELLKYIEQRSHAYLDEMIWFLWDEFEISLDEFTVSRALKRLQWNRKKMIRRSAQRNQALRNDWMHRLRTSVFRWKCCMRKNRWFLLNQCSRSMLC
jgi:transposase